MALTDMSSVVASSQLAPRDAYRLWAPSYDLERNPMLSLEQRVLDSLIPPLAGLDVVDLGCGTGRWLATAKNAGARSLVGVDMSPEMLNVARAKLGSAARLVCAECTDADISSASADVVFCNFVLSYLDAPARLLRFAKTILRLGGSLFLTDVHPGTASELQWRRGVRSDGAFKNIRTYHRSLKEIVELCQNEQLQLIVRMEVPFGPEERAMFEENGKRKYFDRISQHPAIYCLQVTNRTVLQTEELLLNGAYEVKGIRAGRLALGPLDHAPAQICIGGGRVKTITTEETSESAPVAEDLDLDDYLVFPGLVNAHDHLEFALFPRLGRQGYRNSVEWAEDIHRSHSEEIACQRRIPKEVRLWWGGIRNALCGVTTVCHHNSFDPLVFSEDFVVRVLRNYRWAHSLAFEPRAALKRQQTPNGQPFLLHLAEGTDTQSAQEIFDLEQGGALDEHTVVVHGLALGEKGGALLRAASAGLVWCPSSNSFLFGRTMSPAELRRFPKVALGSDSPLTAQGDLLDEIRYAHERLDARAGEIYGYVTREAAQLLHLPNGEGRVHVDGIADLMAIRDSGLTPSECLATSSYKNVELVLLGGRVQLLSPELKQRFPAAACAGLQPLSIEGVVRWIRAPLDWLFAETTEHLGDEIFLGGKRVGRAS